MPGPCSEWTPLRQDFQVPPGAAARMLGMKETGVMCFSTNGICPFSLQLPPQPRWHSLVQMCSGIPRERDHLHRQVRHELAPGRQGRVSCGEICVPADWMGSCYRPVDGELNVTGQLIVPGGRETPVKGWSLWFRMGSPAPLFSSASSGSQPWPQLESFKKTLVWYLSFSVLAATNLKK